MPRLTAVALGALVSALALAQGRDGTGSVDAGAAVDAGTAPSIAPVVTWTGGLSTPESVVHDARADLYYVSNIHGGSLDV
ncbi:MAG: hypothetical protein L0Y66_26610, partial [Myxococcaceae bacterium]|nr:hypothetical protein [Myxococcaceae bacterium]